MMFTKSNLHPRLVRPGQGRMYALGVERIEFLLGSDETEGTFGLGLATLEPGHAPPPHRHRREDEVVLVLEGELEVWTPEGLLNACAGEVVFLPAEVPHACRNPTEQPVRFWVFTNPAGLELFYDECSRLRGPPGGPTPEQVVGVGERHGLEFLHPLP